MAYLDNNGLLYLWNKIKSTFVKQVSGKGLSTNDYTTAEKNKLGGIASGAEVNQYAFSNIKVGSTTVAADTKTDTLELVAGSNVTLTPDAINDKVTIAAKDTTYNAFTGASATVDGKSGLVPAPSKEQQNRFLLGSGRWGDVGIDVRTMDSIAYIYLTDSVSSDNIIDLSSAPFPLASYDSAGLMRGGDKNKLDGIEEGANNFVHPKYTSKASGLYKITVDGTGHVSATSAVAKSDITSLGIPAQDTTYADMKGATSSAAGTHGLVPAPAAGSQSTKYLRADGTWQTPPDTKFTHPSGDGNLHVPATGTANNGKVLKAGATAGSLSWGTLTKADVGLGSTANGAEVNQNAFSNVEVRGANLAARTKTDTLVLTAGNNVTLTPNIEENKVMIAAKDTTYATFGADGDGLVPAPGINGLNKFLTGNGWVGIKTEVSDGASGTTIYFGNANSPGGTSGSNFFEVNLLTASSAHHGVMHANDKAKLDALPTAATLQSTYAKKSDITGMYKYKGSVADATKLPTTGQTTGDVYNIETASAYGGAGMNVAWDGSKWDPLGEIFTITSITNSEIDTICV